MTPHILILAAGSASRMRGADKLVEPVGGLPLLRRVALAALQTGAPVTVALAPDRPLRIAALEGLPVRQVIVPNPQDGMAASLRAGLGALPPEVPVMLLLADLPELTGPDLRQLLDPWAEMPDRILRATAADGTPGHPVCFPAWTRDELMQLGGDAGARSVLERHRDSVTLVALPGQRATTDLDTPEAWAVWRARTGADGG